jgi:hypothetical protein
MAGEYTDFFGVVLRENGYSTKVDLGNSAAQLIHDALNLYRGDDDFEQIKSRMTARFDDLRAAGKTHVSADEFLSAVCGAIFDKSSGTAVVNICNEHVAGLLDAFPNCRVIHMLRNPLTQLNSRYLFRSGDANTFGGSYPGHWEFGKAFRRNFDSFRQAVLFQNDSRVRVVRMEDVQARPEEVVTALQSFLEIPCEPACLTPSRRGAPFRGTRAGKRLDTTDVFVSDDDWSCLSENDLYFCGLITDAALFYDILPTPYRKNRLVPFILRQLGFRGRQRTLPRTPLRVFKVLVVSLAQYFQDNVDKHYFESYVRMSGRTGAAALDSTAKAMNA